MDSNKVVLSYEVISSCSTCCTRRVYRAVALPPLAFAARLRPYYLNPPIRHGRFDA